MKIRISIDVFGLPQEAKNAIKALANSCWGESVFLSPVTMRATFDITGMQAFAKGMDDIQLKYNIK